MTVDSPDLTRDDLPIEGMTCAGCARRIEDELSATPGVDTAMVNFATGRATVTHDAAVDTAALARVVESLGYAVGTPDDGDDAEARAERTLWVRLVTAAALTVPAAAISMVDPLHFDGWRWVVAALVTPVLLWAGRGFHHRALLNLRHRSATMDTLVSLGTLSAFLWSAVVLVGDIDGGHVYFETGAVIITLILLGKWFEARAKRRSGDAIRALADLGAPIATLTDGRQIPVADLEVGMTFVVKPGERVPTDGVVIEGTAAVDTSMITGEPVPVDVAVDDEVIGATVATAGSVTVRATRVGSDTALAQIVRLVDEAQGSRAAVQRLADRVAAVFVPVVLVVAVATLVGWFAAGAGTDDAFTAAVAVLIIACPCALGLATPLAIIVGTGRGAQLGVIIRGGEILEDTRRLDTIVVDKTGTITTGHFTVVEVHPADGTDVAALTQVVAAAAARSEHPVAAAVAATTDTALAVTSFANRAGAGITATVDGRTVALGRAELFHDVPAPLADVAAAKAVDGQTTVFAGRDGVAEAVFVVADTVKDTSPAAVAAFDQLGLDVVMLTGDNQGAAQAVAQAVGIRRVVAEVRPDDKIAEIRRLQQTGHRVAMIGDGINDAPALAQADVGIAMGTGTDVAIEASDLTVVSGDLRAAADAVALARRTLAVIKSNLFWAFAYNAAAIPLAASGVLNPMIAAAAMGLSSVFVVANSGRLRRFRGYRRPTSARSDGGSVLLLDP